MYYYSTRASSLRNGTIIFFVISGLRHWWTLKASIALDSDDAVIEAPDA